MLVRGLVVVTLSGCLVGAGPTVSYRATGPRHGLHAGIEDVVLIGRDQTEKLPRYVGVASGMSFSLATPGEQTMFIAAYGVFAFSQLHDERAAPFATGTLGVSRLQVDGQSSQSDAVLGSSAGILSGVTDCSGFAGSIEVGVRWIGGSLEAYLSARINHLSLVDNECGFRLGG